MALQSVSACLQPGVEESKKGCSMSYASGTRDRFLEEATSTAKWKAFLGDNGEKSFKGCGSSQWAGQKENTTENCQSREVGWGSVMREGRNQLQSLKYLRCLKLIFRLVLAVSSAHTIFLKLKFP